MTAVTAMNIDADVNRVARAFGVDPALLQAVVNAESDIVRAVKCSIPTVSTRAEALQITSRSAVHAVFDWIKRRGDEWQADYIVYWATPADLSAQLAAIDAKVDQLARDEAAFHARVDAAWKKTTAVFAKYIALALAAFFGGKALK